MQISKYDDHISQRFQILDFIGKGAYGVVWKVKEIQTNKLFALKKVPFIITVFRRFWKSNRCPAHLPWSLNSLAIKPPQHRVSPWNHSEWKPKRYLPSLWLCRVRPASGDSSQNTAAGPLEVHRLLANESVEVPPLSECGPPGLKAIQHTHRLRLQD